MLKSEQYFMKLVSHRGRQRTQYRAPYGSCRLKSFGRRLFKHTLAAGKGSACSFTGFDQWRDGGASQIAWFIGLRHAFIRKAQQ
jgi:hypothetical protein